MSNWRRVPLSITDDDAIKQLMVTAGKSDKEQCGFILDGTMILHVENKAEEPAHSFAMAVEDQTSIAYEYQDRITAIWHTHPSGRPWPSTTDDNGMADLYAAGCPWSYVIVTTSSVREYRHIARDQRDRTIVGSGSTGQSGTEELAASVHRGAAEVSCCYRDSAEGRS